MPFKKGLTTPRPYVCVTRLDVTTEGFNPYSTPPFNTLKLTAYGIKFPNT